MTKRKTAEPGSKQSTAAELDWPQTKKKKAAEPGSKQSTAAELD
jgi:hypothetical protein